jgi:hypothetical protein
MLTQSARGKRFVSECLDFFVLQEETNVSDCDDISASLTIDFAVFARTTGKEEGCA